MKDNRQEYELLVGKETPIFHQPFWLDIVAAGSWNALIAKEADIVAVMPYVLKNNCIVMPSLTQYLGPHFYNTSSISPSQCHKLLDRLIIQLPTYSRFEQRWSYDQSDWLPFYWSGFDQTTKYTCLLKDIKYHDVLLKGVNENTRRKIKSGIGSGYSISSDGNLEDFFLCVKALFEKKNMRVPYEKRLIFELINKTREKNHGELLFLKDDTGTTCGGIFIVWDTRSAYYIIGGVDERADSRWAFTYLMWEAILFSSKFVDAFDFAGSMIKGINRFFTSFGATQLSYSEIKKTNSKYLLTKSWLKELLT